MPDTKLLYGKNDEEHIVGIHIDEDSSEQEGQTMVRIYKRHSTGHTQSHVAKLFPFFYLSDMSFLKTFPDDAYNFMELEGDNFYKYMVWFTDWFTMWKAVGKIKERAYTMGLTENPKDYPKQLYVIKTPEEQYLIQTGKTFFKGMEYNDVHRFRFDIETYSSRDGFPNPERIDDRIIIITVADNRNYKATLYLNECGVDPADVPNGIAFPNESALLRGFFDIVKRLNPDTMEGHNVFAFDFRYIIRRAEMHGVLMDIGRDGSIPEVYESSKRFAERDLSYLHVKIAGRSVIDTLFETMNFDTFTRELPGYGLKVVAKHFGFSAEDRTYVEGDKISWHWDNDAIALLRYAEDDTTECSALSNHLGGSTFFLTQMLPMTYQRAALAGTSSKIEALLVRHYLDEYYSIPGSETARQEVGGYTDLFMTGVYSTVVYVDVESLYPSIMLNYNVCPEGDDLRAFPQLLQMLTDLRFEAKHARKKFEKGSKEYQSMDSRQNSYKTLINSFYGMLGFTGARFNDFSEADRVTVIGQGLLRRMVNIIRADGGDVIEVDTDGVLALAPPFVYTAGDEVDKVRAEAWVAAEEGRHAAVDDETYVRSMTDRMPEGIVIGFDGRAVRMISYKKKNYALREAGSKKPKIKGGSLISRSYESFGKKFVAEVIDALMDRDVRRIAEIYRRTRAMIVEGTWDVLDFMKRSTLKDPIDVYIRKTQRGSGNGGRNKDAGYELAIQRFHETGLRPEPGDRIRYFITGDKKTVKAFEAARFIEDWKPPVVVDGNVQTTENTKWYLGRLKTFTEKFEKFFTPEHFEIIFSETPVEEIDFDQIQVLNKRVQRKPVSIVFVGPEEKIDDAPFWIERALAGAKFLKTLDTDDEGIEMATLVTSARRGGFDEDLVKWAEQNGIPIVAVPINEKKGAAKYRALAVDLKATADGLDNESAAIILEDHNSNNEAALEVVRIMSDASAHFHISKTV